MNVDISKYRRIVVLTGAGVSVASVLRLFRGPGGIWDKHDVARYGHVDALRSRPADTLGVWKRSLLPHVPWSRDLRLTRCLPGRSGSSETLD